MALLRGKQLADASIETSKLAAGIGARFSDVIIIQEQYPSGGSGFSGTFTSGDWRTRILNTEVVDTGNHASVNSSTGVITLAAGTYVVEGSAPAWYVNGHQTRLRNTSDSTTLLSGTSEYTNQGTLNAQSKSLIKGRFTIAAQKTIELQHRCQTTHSGNGLGNAASFGETEVMSEITFYRENNAGMVSRFSDYILIEEQEPAGTAAGSFSSGGWRTRLLDTEVFDTGGHASIASNQITLAAGTYCVIARAPGYAADRHKLRLQNITDASTLLIGSSEFNSTPSAIQTTSWLFGRIILTAQKVLELQHRNNANQPTNGFGVESNLGVTEVYAQILFFRESG